MKPDRTYKGGRPTGRWRKGERITSHAQVKAGDLLIKDSHQFGATNLVKVSGHTWPHPGFAYNFAWPDGRVIKEPDMMAHEFELGQGVEVFYRAERPRWPTPQTSDAARGAEGRATKRRRGAGGINLREACNAGGRMRGPLNPEWVEALMGFPPGWTSVLA